MAKGKGKWYHLSDPRRPGKRLAHAWLVPEGVERYKLGGWLVEDCTCPDYAEVEQAQPTDAERVTGE